MGQHKCFSYYWTFLITEIQPRIQLSQTYPPYKSSAWVRQERSDRQDCVWMTWWLHVLLWLSRWWGDKATDPSMALFLIGEQGEGKYSSGKKKCVSPGYAVRRYSVSLLTCTSLCDSYFLPPQAACSACLCMRLFLWLPWEEYFWCFPCACWAFCYQSRLKQHTIDS